MTNRIDAHREVYDRLIACWAANMVSQNYPLQYVELTESSPDAPNAGSTTLMMQPFAKAQIQFLRDVTSLGGRKLHTVYEQLQVHIHTPARRGISLPVELADVVRQAFDRFTGATKHYEQRIQHDTPNGPWSRTWVISEFYYTFVR